MPSDEIRRALEFAAANLDDRVVELRPTAEAAPRPSPFDRLRSRLRVGVCPPYALKRAQERPAAILCGMKKLVEPLLFVASLLLCPLAVAAFFAWLAVSARR
jgi:hypothetical protein